MSFAVCLQCGAEKIGGLSPCHVCGYEPETSEDRAKSLILTDHFLSHGDLNAIAKQIKSGSPATFSPESVAGIQEAIEQSDRQESDSSDLPSERRSSPRDWLWVLAIIAVFAAVFWFLLQ